MIENEVKIVLNRKALENVDSFIYLGSLMTLNNDCSADVARRMKLASAAFSNLSTMLKDNGITLQVKIQLLQACDDRAVVCGRDLDAEKARRTQAAGIRDAMLPPTDEHKMAGHEKE